MTVNAGGTFLCCQVFGEAMKKRKQGSIINLGSIYGVVAPDQGIYGKSGINSPAVYGASKAAVIQLTKYLASQWGAHGVRVNCLSPGGIANNQHAAFVANYSKKSPMGRLIDKKELKGAVVFLASDAASSVTGHNLLVDGGWTLR
jgi:NAD(P)-dependent dehydrogenase (short-subunit alcohol dehydrogenase family)